MKAFLLLCVLAAVSCEELAKESRGQEYYAPVSWEGLIYDDKAYNQEGLDKILVVGKQLRYGDGVEKLTYNDNDYPYYILGRHGLGFEKRLARADGLRQPLTPAALRHVGYRTRKDEEKFVPLS